MQNHDFCFVERLRKNMSSRKNECVGALRERFCELNNKIETVRRKYQRTHTHPQLFSSNNQAIRNFDLEKIRTEPAPISHKLFSDENSKAYKNSKADNQSDYYIRNFRGQAGQHWRRKAESHIQVSLRTLQLLNGEVMPNPTEVQQRQVMLPMLLDPNRKTVVLDLDETLVHCSRKRFSNEGTPINIPLPSGRLLETSITARPFARQLLAALSDHFEVVIFTASSKAYADAVIGFLDPKGQYVSHRLYREHCVSTNLGLLVKDLRVIGNRLPENIVLVDNAHYSYLFQLNNAIPILPFRNNESDDRELQYLLRYLTSVISGAEDVRTANQNHFKLSAYGLFDDSESLINNLYGE